MVLYLYNICLIECDLLEDIFLDPNQPDDGSTCTVNLEENDVKGQRGRLQVTNALSHRC